MFDEWSSCRYESVCDISLCNRLDQRASFRVLVVVVFFFQAEDGIRDLVRSRGLGDVYKRQRLCSAGHLERLAQGVYRDAGAPSVEFEGLRAAWLSLIHI